MRANPFPRFVVSLLAALLCASPLAADVICQGTSPSGEFSLTVTLSPDPGTTLAQSDPCPGEMTIRGSAVDASHSLFDVFFVIDSSGSTFAASGVDVDGDTFLGEGDFLNNTDPGDSVLAAEVAAVRSFVRNVDPDRVRIAIVEFSAIIPIPPGRPEEQGRIRIVQSLTDNFALVEAGLDDMLARGSVGATDYGGAVYKLIEEWTANAEPDERTAIAFFISDGKPTFPRYPYDTTEIPDVDWALTATADAAALGIEINTYELGNFDDLSTLLTMADMTGGDFYADLDPADLILTLESASLVAVESVIVENLETGESQQADVRPDGRFSVRLGLIEGLNRFRVTATTTGTEPIQVICETDVTILCIQPAAELPGRGGSGGRTVPEVPGLDRSYGWGTEGVECEPRDAPFWADLCGPSPNAPAGVIRAFPQWSSEVDALLAPFGVTTCEALGGGGGGGCSGALYEYAAMLLNRVSGLLPDWCASATLCDCDCECLPGWGDISYVLDLSYDIEDIATAGELIQRIGELIQQGMQGDEAACRLAELLARQANGG
jgi:hypothetical protein